MDPELFRYADRLRRGKQPARDRLSWETSPDERRFHRSSLDKKVQVRQDGFDIFDTVTYDRPYSGRGGRWPLLGSHPMTRRNVKRLTDVSIASANIGSPVDEPLGPKNETKAQGGWKLADGAFAVEPLDPRIPGVDYQVVGRNSRQGLVSETEKARPMWNPDSWEARRPEIPQRSGARHWSETQTETLVELAFQNEVQDWRRIASEVGQSVIECQAKWRELASLELSTHAPPAWTLKQQTELMRFVDDYGLTDWVRISHFLEQTPEACIAKHAELMSSRSSRHFSIKRSRNDEDDQPEQLQSKKAKRSNRATTSASEDVLAIGVGRDAAEPKGATRPRSGKRKLDDEPAEMEPRGKKLRLNGPVRKDPLGETSVGQTSGMSSPSSRVRATIGTSQQVSSQQPQLVSQSRRILRLRPPKAPAGISSPSSRRATMDTSQQVSSQQPQLVSQSRRILRLRPPKAPAT